MSVQFVKLGEMAETTSGGTPARGNLKFYGGNIPWIKSGELPDGEINSAEERITKLGLENSNTKILPAGTLLIAMYGATVGRLGILTFPAATNQAVCAILPCEKIDRDFLFFWLLKIRAELLKKSFGGAQPNISQAIIREVKIPFLTIEKQRQIAAKLKAQLAEVDRARQAAQAQLRELSLILNHVIEEHILRAISKGKNLVELGEVATISAKIVNPTLPEYCYLPHISAENIEKMTGRLLAIKSAKDDRMTSGKYLFDEGDILYSKLRPYLRKVAQPTFKGVCSADMYPVKVVEGRLNAAFLKLLLTSNLFTDYANEQSARSRMPKLNREQLFAFKFTLPSVIDQQDCINRTRDAVDCVSQAIESAKVMLSEIDLLPQKILAQAFEIQS